MMRQKPLLAYILIVLLTLTMACQTEILVTKVDPAKPDVIRTDGVLFSLPETLVLTEIPLTKVATSPGVFLKWTQFFYPELTSNEYTTEQTTAFKVGVPTFSTRGQTDPDNVYIAHIKAKQFETKTLLLEFNEDGIIARAEASSKDETIDLITSGIKTAASFVAPLLGVPALGPIAFAKSRDVPTRCEPRAEAARAAAEKAAAARVTANAANAIAASLVAQGAQLAVRKRANEAARVADQTAFNAEALAEAEKFAADQCFNDHVEDLFKEQLSARELALYESLDAGYKSFLRNNFGYDFLTYVAKKEDVGGTHKSANVEFFFTLNEKQQEFISKLPRSGATCVGGMAGTPCLASTVKIELLRAKVVFDKIQELRHQRAELISKHPESQTPNSSILEFKLKELDAQIKSLEQTYFLGSSTETSATAKFEFKPTAGGPPQNLFTYAEGGSSPGICKDSVPPDMPGVFKAVWPRKLEGTCRADNHSFKAEDFRDLEAFRGRLNAVAPGAPAPPPGATPDLVSTFVYSRLGLGTRALVAGPIKTPQQVDALVSALSTDLNAILTGGASIYVAATFSNVKLSPETIKLINAGPPAADIVRVNRLLLEDAYRKEFYRQSAWVSRQVLLRVASAPPGLASTVKNAIDSGKLTEPGKRGFPYRVAPMTLANVWDVGVEKGRADVRIAQFGPVRTLPAHLGGRRSSYKVTYYDASGAIKIFDLSSDALIQKQNVTDLTDAATTLRDSEAANLKRQTDLLNAKKDKLNAEKALIEAERNLKAARNEPSPTPSPP